MTNHAHESVLDEAIARYCVLSQRHQEAVAALRVAKHAAEALYQAEQEAADMAFIDLALAETALREATLAAYQATGNRTPAPGVGVRVRTEYQYDLQHALGWALEHRMALTLDVKAFEALCKHDATRPAFVTPVTTPQTTIGSHLKGTNP